MIGSFWNLCRACPSMPIDKLHSEYRSTYRWHEYTGSRQDVVRRPPQPKTSTMTGETQTFQPDKPEPVRLNQEDADNEGLAHKLEPAMPRRKKHPELAYKTHEFMSYDEDGSSDSIDASSRGERARSEERAGFHLRPSRRSRSEGPPRGPSMYNMSLRGEDGRRRDSDPDPDLELMDSGGLLRKAISRISTEYRLQFAWPPGHSSRTDANQQKDNSLPKKSLSMGAIKPSAHPGVHKKRNELDTKDVSELEPLVSNGGVFNDETNAAKLGQDGLRNDYKKNYRHISQAKVRSAEREKIEQETLIGQKENGPNRVLYSKPNANWYKEAVELRKKAGEYKQRGWGTELAPEHISELYNKQLEVWDQVSRRSSLSALSLASTVHKSYTKEEKEQENNKRNSPTKAIHNDKAFGRGRDSVDARVIKDMIRHHLERTTGGSELDGLILSPTREKLEPTLPRKNEEIIKHKESHSQKSSPKKDSSLKPSAKKSTQKPNTKSVTKQIRSQSVGPVETTEKRSPKRLSRSTTVKQPKSVRESANSPPSNTSRRPRPSSLNTTASSRSKCTVPLKNATSEDRLPKKTNKFLKDNRSATPQSRDKQKSASATSNKTSNSTKEATCSEPPSCAIGLGDEESSVEHVVKSPPEPTRVKSPEQIMMRSPDPVNWTVPLDTGKTFTVTQNVREGEMAAVTRPHSEVKVWTPPDCPPPAAVSAPPQLADQTKTPATAPNPAQAPDNQAYKMIENNISSVQLPQQSNPTVYDVEECSTKIPYQTSEKMIAEVAEVDETTPPQRSLASEVLEKARTRFDMFWGKNKPNPEDTNQ